MENKLLSNPPDSMLEIRYLLLWIMKHVFQSCVAMALMKFARADTSFVMCHLSGYSPPKKVNPLIYTIYCVDNEDT